MTAKSWYTFVNYKFNYLKFQTLIMNRKIIGLLTFIAVASIMSCNSGDDYKKSENSSTSEKSENAASSNSSTSESGSDTKGIGKFKNVELTHPLDQKMVAAGKSIYDLKCSSCHKLTDEKLVGPGWKGVTDRRAPEWIMNFVTNTEEMIQKDNTAKNLFEICLVKMPNQNLQDDDARHILEFMRNNDGKN
jgi:cytochrome c2